MPGLRIQASGRLIEQQQARVVDQRTGQAQPTLHTAGQFARLGIRLVRERGEFQQTRNTGPNLRIFHAKVAAINQQVFSAGEIRIQGVKLADHAELRLDGQCIPRHLPAQCLDLAGVWHRQAQAHADGGGFTGAIGADHAQAFTCGDTKREPVNHLGGAIAFGQIADR